MEAFSELWSEVIVDMRSLVSGKEHHRAATPTPIEHFKADITLYIYELDVMSGWVLPGRLLSTEITHQCRRDEASFE